MAIVHELRIFCDQDGNVGAEGPLDNRGICYYMLEMTRDIVFERHLANVEKTKGRIQLVPGGLIGLKRD